MSGPRWYAYIYPKNFEVMASRKIFTPDFAPHASYCLDTSGNLFFTGGAAGGYGLIIKPPFSEFFLLATLNSRLLDALLCASSTVFRGGWHSYEARFIRDLPIRRIDFTTPKAQRERIAKKGVELHAAALAKGDPGKALNFVERELAEGRTDTVHDLLAHLAGEMTALNTAKGKAVRQFLADLRDFHKVDAMALKPKSRLDEFWKLTPADLFAHLKANKVRLPPSDENNLRQRFEKARSEILSLEPRLVFTDALIDQTVYRLYGLTAEEVKLIEGSDPR